jgi:hypothetical protein
MRLPFSIQPPAKAPWYWLLLFIASMSALYMTTQFWIGALPVPECGLGDRLQLWTAGVNSFLHENRFWANGAIILYASIGDAIVLFLVISSFVQKSVRPILPLIFFLILRQTLQLLVAFPLPDGLIWRHPGIDSLFSTYHVTTDFYFSAYVGINLLGNLELRQGKLFWLKVCGVVSILLVAFLAIALRLHYTPDLYTSLMSAVCAYFLAQPLIPKVDSWIRGKPRMWIGGTLALGLVLMFSLQSIIGDRPVAECRIFDQVQVWLAPLHQFLLRNLPWQNVQLSMMNAGVEGLVYFLAIKTLIDRDIRPFLTLAIFFWIRQPMQMLVTFPIPETIIWHDPGFPTLMTTYEISHDFYFSGHTGISMVGMFELIRYGKRWLTALAILVVVFEIFSALVTYAHYTADVYTAVITVSYIPRLAAYLAPRINEFLSRYRLSQ